MPEPRRLLDRSRRRRELEHDGDVALFVLACRTCSFVLTISQPCGNRNAKLSTGWKNSLPRTMPFSRLSPKTMPSSTLVQRGLVPRGAAGGRGRHGLLHFHDTVGRRRMRQRPVRHAAPGPGRLVESRQRAEQPLHAFGIPAARRRIGHAEPIGLELVLAAVLQEQHPERDLRDALQGLRFGHEDAQDRQAAARERLP